MRSRKRVVSFRKTRVQKRKKLLEKAYSKNKPAGAGEKKLRAKSRAISLRRITARKGVKNAVQTRCELQSIVSTEKATLMTETCLSVLLTFLKEKSTTFKQVVGLLL